MAAHHRCHLCKGGFCTGAHACAHRCFHLRSSFFTLRCLIRDKHFFPSWRRQLVLRAIGLVLWCNGPCGPSGAMSASTAGHLPSIMSGLTMANFTARQTNSGVRRLGSNFRLRRLRTESDRKNSGPRSVKPDLVRRSPGPRIRRQRLQVRQLERSMKIVSLRLRTRSSNRRSQEA